MATKKKVDAFNIVDLILSAVSLGEGFRNSTSEMLVNIITSFGKIKLKNPDREHPDYVDAVEWVVNLSNSIVSKDRAEQVREIIGAVAGEMAASSAKNRDNFLVILSKRNPKMVARHVNAMILSLLTNVIVFENLFKNIGSYIDNESPFANADFMIFDCNAEDLPTSSKQYEAAFLTLNLFMSYTILRKKFEAFNKADASGTKKYIMQLLARDRFKAETTDKSVSYRIELPHPTVDTPEGDKVLPAKPYTDGPIVVSLTVETVTPTATFDKSTVRASVLKK